MATTEFEENKTSAFEAWMMHHGAAKVLLACVTFWTLFAVGIYLSF